MMNIDYAIKEVIKVSKESRELCDLYCEVMLQVEKGYYIVADLLQKYELLKKKAPMKILDLHSAKKEYLEAYNLLELMKVQGKMLKQDCINERKKFLKIEGLYEAIERLALVDRDSANGWIVLLNEIKGEGTNEFIKY